MASKARTYKFALLRTMQKICTVKLTLRVVCTVLMLFLFSYVQTDFAPNSHGFPHKLPQKRITDTTDCRFLQIKNSEKGGES